MDNFVPIFSAYSLAVSNTCVFCSELDEIKRNCLKEGKSGEETRKFITSYYADKNKITLSIDINSSTDKIKREVVEIIKEFKIIKGNAKKPHLYEYKRYLEVYDLKEKGWTWSRLAKKYFPDDHIWDAKRKVMRYNKKCKDLINFGYSQIR